MARTMELLLYVCSGINARATRDVSGPTKAGNVVDCYGFYLIRERDRCVLGAHKPQNILGHISHNLRGVHAP